MQYDLNFVVCQYNFETVNKSKLILIENEKNPFIASDEEGNSWDYSSVGSYALDDPLISASDWLGIQMQEYED